MFREQNAASGSIASADWIEIRRGFAAPLEKLQRRYPYGLAAALMDDEIAEYVVNATGQDVEGTSWKT